MIEDIAKMSLSGFMIAEVRNNIDPELEGKIAVFIPQLMYQYEYNEKPYEQTTDVDVDTELVINADDFKDKQLEVEESNYIWARPLTFYEDNIPNWKNNKKFYNAGSLRVPRIGSQVLIMFLNSDLQKCYYFPFSPTFKDDIIDSANCYKEKNFEGIETRPNVDVIRFYWDGMRIEADTNDHVLKLSAPNGNAIELSDAGIKLKGNVTIENGDLEIGGSVHIHDRLDVDSFVTFRDRVRTDGTSYINGKLLARRYNISAKTEDTNTSK